MNNVRGLYPPLFGATPSGGGGGGGGGQHIQVDTLPEASLANKDKIVQYVGSTTETLTNAYFYKCVENTGYDWEETEASETYTEAETLPTASAETIGTIYKVDDKYYQTIIVLTYSWDNIEVMPVSSGGKVAIATVTADGSTTYASICNTLASAIQNIISIEKTYIMTVATANVCNIYNCVEISNSGIVFFNELMSVSSTGVGSLNDIHYVLDFNGSSKYFYNGTAQGSNQTPSNNAVFTIYEL